MIAPDDGSSLEGTLPLPYVTDDMII
jgi:hypothetical protein